MVTGMPDTTTPPETDLLALREVIEGPLHGIARRFSRFLSDRWPHTALVIFTRECTGRPRKVAGATDMVNKVTIDELEQLKTLVEPDRPQSTTAAIGGATRTLRAAPHTGGPRRRPAPRAPPQQPPRPLAPLADLGIVATSVSPHGPLGSPG